LQEKLSPTITGWAAHAEPFAFERGPQRLASGMERFLHGSPAVACLFQASAGYEVLLEAGIERIREHSIRLTEGLRTDLIERGFTINSPEDPAERGGTLAVGLEEDEDGAAFVQALAARDVLVDHRPQMGLRASPHFYTTAEELSAFAEHLSDLRASGSWRSHLEESTAY
jgi:kynureninase